MVEGRGAVVGFHPAGNVSDSTSELPIMPEVEEPSGKVEDTSGVLMPIGEEPDEKEMDEEQEEAEEAHRRVEVVDPHAFFLLFAWLSMVQGYPRDLWSMHPVSGRRNRNKDWQANGSAWDALGLARGQNSVVQLLVQLFISPL